MSMADKLTIGEVSRRTGVPAKTIRFYEAEGIIATPRRSESGYRLYSAAMSAVGDSCGESGCLGCRCPR